MNPEKINKSHILIVDDNPTNVDVLLNYLDNAGYEVSVAEDGEDALEQSQYAPPDLILLDILMPGIDGFETCCRLKDNPKTADIPVIFVTALSNAGDEEKGFEVGAIDYLTKPVIPAINRSKIINKIMYIGPWDKNF